MQGFHVNEKLRESENYRRKRTKMNVLFLYENHKNGRFRIFGGRECCSRETVVLECVSEADETICTGWEVIAH